MQSVRARTGADEEEHDSRKLAPNTPQGQMLFFVWCIDAA